MSKSPLLFFLNRKCFRIRRTGIIITRATPTPSPSTSRLISGGKVTESQSVIREERRGEKEEERGGGGEGRRSSPTSSFRSMPDFLYHYCYTFFLTTKRWLQFLMKCLCCHTWTRQVRRPPRGVIKSGSGLSGASRDVEAFGIKSEAKMGVSLFFCFFF